MSTLLKIAYKFRFLLSLFIAFFLGFFFLKLTCKASAVPTLNSSVFQTFENTAEQMLDLGFVPQSLSPYDSVVGKFDPWQAGAALLNFDLNDCVTTELTYDQKSVLFEDFTVVNYLQYGLTVDDPIYCVKMDNGYFTGYCYVDDSGHMLYYTNDLGGQLLQIKYGGEIKSSEDWENFYYNTATKVYESNFIYSTDYQNGTLPDVSYYLLGGLKSGGNAYVVELYIPNQYEKGVCVPNAWYGTGEIYEWYCNGTPYKFGIVWGGDYNTSYDFQVTAGTFTRDGVSYTYKIRRNFGSGPANNTYENWTSGLDRNHYTLAHYGYIYNSNTASSVANSETISFKPLETSEGDTIINYNYYYDPEAISALHSEISSLSQSVNNLYNNQNPISENNFPFYYPATQVESSPSEIPFPNVVNYPDFTPLPEASTDPALNYEAITQPANETVLQSFSNLQIPFLQNIRYRFPFCIPWDIRDALSLLQFSPTAPSWDFNWDIQVGTHVYRYHFAGDLSDFDSLALLFRRLTLCAVIIALAFWSYRIFF